MSTLTDVGLTSESLLVLYVSKYWGVTSRNVTPAGN
jgi:hypothetical protein